MRSSAPRSSPTNFNPRLPGGRRHSSCGKNYFLYKFQSTPPGWEATADKTICKLYRLISIHASRVGGDDMGMEPEWISVISIHASRVGGDITQDVKVV